MGTLRGLTRAGNDIARLGFDRPGETVELVDRAESIVFNLSQSRVSSEFAHIDDLLKDSFETITKLYEAGSDITGTPAGFRDLDRLTSGFQPGNLVIIAARPSMGKSALALCMASNVAVRHDTPVALFTLEMSEAEVRRGQGRVAAFADGQARRRRLAAADRRLRQAREGADLRRRHGLDHDDGDPVEAAPAEDEGAAARARDHRLPAADDEQHLRREPCPGGLADLARAEGARARPRGADHRALPVVARRRAAPRQAADPLRPARVGLDRAGRRPRDV